MKDLILFLCTERRVSEVSRLSGHTVYQVCLLICLSSKNTDDCSHQEFSEAPQSLKDSSAELVSEALETELLVTDLLTTELQVTELQVTQLLATELQVTYLLATTSDD